ncbi:ABC transporter permease [Rhizobium multihospitium]|nr:ABC transporter permease [Rhizobium multihospitium]
MLLLKYTIFRLFLMLVTLALVSIIIFSCVHLLPGDVARAMLGPLADARAVAELNAKLGTDRSVFVQYGQWFHHAITGDFGISLSMRRPVTPEVLKALANSASLAAMTIILVVPLGIGGGVVAGLYQKSALDRLIILSGVSLSVIPDFVSALLLMIVFALWLNWFPLDGPADGSGFWSSTYHLILPALPLVFNLLGYVARMTRAGVVEVINADYTRTAILKGLPPRTVLVRHVLPNALAPTIAVLATQSGALLGGLVVVEALFNIQGLGNLVLTAAKARDFPMLEAGVLTMAAAYAVTSLAGDLLQSLLNPRLRVGHPS